MSAARRASWCTSTSRRSARSPQAGAGASTDATAHRPAAPSDGRWATRTWHVAIDDYSRVAYVEAHDDETAKTLVGFWRRAQGWFWSNDMPVDEVLTDNGPNFVSDAFADQLAERRIVHRRTRPYRPQTNGKAERFNRTLADEVPLQLQVPIRVRAAHPPQTLGPRLQLSPTPHRRRRPARITCQQPHAN